MTEQQQFLAYLDTALQQQQFQRLILSQYQGEIAYLQKISLRLIELNQQPMLSATFHYRQQDKTQNYSLEQAMPQIEHWLNDCKQANLFTQQQQIQLKKGKKSSRLLIQQQAEQLKVNTQHDREKQRYLQQDSAFLQALGITDAQSQIIPAMSRKWKQINKFIEILSLELDDIAQQRPLHIVDFGSGKGYLTFALYEYLKQHGQEPHMVGVELRHHLVEFCQKVAQQVQFKQLHFFEGDVRTYQPEQLDVMIALHACDVATDFAIHTGIRLNAQMIVCSPCCHKE